ncbi:MAG TPA: hypothetical protein VE842_04500 [Pyrinomonadaceae bacterium]|jgi:uncharacterized membrane protein|nr:hypothetical protein [Pyrinomonadaceae bacterium]
MMERIWTIVSGLGIIVAAIFLLRDNMSAAFVSATLGVVAWFLGLRERLRKTIDAKSEGTRESDHNTGGDLDEN